MKFLQKFSELQKCTLEEQVFFYGKVLSFNRVEGRVTIRFYDGFSPQSFNVFNEDFELPCNKLYKFIGTVHGFDRNWFKLGSIEEMIPTYELEKKFFPERFYKITAELQYVYLNSYSLIDNELYRKVLTECLGLGTVKALDNEVFKNPASLKYHDNYKGGLVNHIASMLNTCRIIQSEYAIKRKNFVKEIDWSLLYTLIYLHDIGKPDTYCLTNDGGFKWNDSVALNHAVLGVCKVYEACVRIGIDPKCKDIQVLLKGI